MQKITYFCTESVNLPVAKTGETKRLPTLRRPYTLHLANPTTGAVF